MRVAVWILVGSLLSGAGWAQTSKVLKQGKETPAALWKKPYMLWDADVSRHWPRMLGSVNIPGEQKDASPGECLRVGAVASGEGHEHFLDGAEIAFTVKFAGQEAVTSSAPIAAVKVIKPEGSDEVSGALQAGGIKYELPTSAAMAASAGKWCVPDDAQAGNAEIHATVTLQGKQTALETVTIRVLTPESTTDDVIAKGDDALSKWMMTYHEHPEAAWLGVAILRARQSDKFSAIVAEGLVAALAQDKATAARLGPYLSASDPMTRLMGVRMLQMAGVTLKKTMVLSDEDKKMLSSMEDLPDPFTFSPDETQFTKLDMLWSRFTVTGDREPVDAMAAMLAWHVDYAAFVKLQQAHARGEKTPTSLTPELVRGVAYTAVGWSIQSFQRTDGLAADYFAAIAADPVTSKDVKAELAGIWSNPAFKQSR